VKPSASVIVPTRNRAPVLRACLQSLAAQTMPAERFEVIVVDNGSSDDTAAVARAFDGPLRLRLLHEPEPGLHIGRHAGWRAAQSDVLMFADDDIEAEPGWVEAVAAAFDDPAVALVGGNDRPNFEHAPPAWLQRWWSIPVAHGRALGYLSILDFGERRRFDIDPAWVWGCNFNVRRSVLEAARGFHPDGVPKDRLRWRGDGEMHVGRVVRERGARTLFDAAASVRHRVDGFRMTADYFEQRAFAQGVSDSYATIRRAGGLRPQWQAPLRRWLGRWRDRRLARPADDPVVMEWRSVLAAVRRGHAAGAAFHRQAVREDPALLAWVLKEDYL
jgi:glucosyl-dolichyl phosphate glucuronosyltransferase